VELFFVFWTSWHKTQEIVSMKGISLELQGFSRTLNSQCKLPTDLAFHRTASTRHRIKTQS